MSRELLARAWQAGAGPGDSPLTIDLDSTICETYGAAGLPGHRSVRSGDPGALRVHLFPVGRTATSNCAFETSMPTNLASPSIQGYSL